MYVYDTYSLAVKRLKLKDILTPYLKAREQKLMDAAVEKPKKESRNKWMLPYRSEHAERSVATPTDQILHNYVTYATD